MRTSDSIEIGEVEVCPHEHSVLVRGHDVALTSREFDIVMALAEHPGWVFSADQLAGDPDQGDYSPESVSVLVSRARHKLTSAGAPDLIETVRGLGYRLRPLEPTEESAPAEQTRRDFATPRGVCRRRSWRPSTRATPTSSARSPRCWRRHAARYTPASPSDVRSRLKHARFLALARFRVKANVS